MPTDNNFASLSLRSASVDHDVRGHAEHDRRGREREEGEENKAQPRVGECHW